MKTTPISLVKALGINLHNCKKSSFLEISAEQEEVHKFFNLRATAKICQLIHLSQ